MKHHGQQGCAPVNIKSVLVCQLYSMSIHAHFISPQELDFTDDCINSNNFPAKLLHFKTFLDMLVEL